MNEYYTPALVLGHAPKNDKDLNLSLYTQKLGRVNAIAKSIRKITSKLSGHLAPGKLADVRLVDRGSYQLVDALSHSGQRVEGETLKFLGFLEEMTPYNNPDQQLWHTALEIVKGAKFSPEVYRYLLGMMGFVSGEHPRCKRCRRQGSQVVYFYAPDIIFVCSSCSAEVGVNESDLVKIS